MSWLPEHFDVFAGADVSAHKEAGKELTLVSVISAAPFLVGMVAFLLVKPAPFEQDATPLSYLEAVFLRGQLFLISVSFLATSLHRLFNSDRSYRRPDIINVFSVILFGIIGVFYGINPSFAHSDDSTVVGMSLVFFRYVSFVLLLYSGTRIRTTALGRTNTGSFFSRPSRSPGPPAQGGWR